jgi:hypothetical protein
VNRQPRDHDANDHGAPLAPGNVADLPPHPAD